MTPAWEVVAAGIVAPLPPVFRMLTVLVSVIAVRLDTVAPGAIPFSFILSPDVITPAWLVVAAANVAAVPPELVIATVEAV
jgi:hypothetical protein